MAGAEGRVVVGRLARGDRRVDRAVQLAERVREAFGMTGRAGACPPRRRAAAPGCGAGSRSAASRCPSHSSSCRSDPRRARRASRRPRSGRVLAAGAHLRDHEPSRARRRAKRSRMCAKSSVVICDRRRARTSAAGRERLDLADRAAAARGSSSPGRRTALDLQPGHELHEVEPVRADVADGAQLAALLGLEPPVPVRRLAAASPAGSRRDVPDLAELAGLHACARLLHQRVEADVEVRAVHEAAAPRRARAARATAPRSSPAASRRPRACRPRAPASPAGSGGGSASSGGRRRPRRRRAAPRSCRTHGRERLRRCALGRRADDAGDLHAQPPQRVDVDGADEAGADDAGPQVRDLAAHRGSSTSKSTSRP